MRLLPLVLFAVSIPGRVGAQPPLDYCAAIAAVASVPGEREARLREQIGHASNQLDLAFELFGSLRPELSHENASKLFRLTILHWLEIEQGLCSCQAGSADPTCEKLPAEVARSCEIEPRGLHGINVRCLTKGH